MTVPDGPLDGLPRPRAAARNIEMAAAMIVPSIIAAMLGVMLWRYDEYAQSH